ncbi:transposase [Aliagarivorans marinus]|uniref:transposase n=1 Tax=Aliagarivorans marinus TaxID=561965 RepID=UPI00047A2ADC|nr:transposase [Aliagarivorans marinus]
MKSVINYSTQFKREAVKQMIENDYSAIDVAYRLGISTRVLYDWVRAYSDPSHHCIMDQALKMEKTLQAEVKRLQQELKLAQHERDILKEAYILSSAEPEDRA